MARTSAKAKKPKQVVSTKRNGEKSAEASEIKDKAVGKKDNLDDSTDKENDVNFEVEKIVHTRVFKGKRQYLIRWKGYGEDSDTWENESSVESCEEALETFKKENSSLVEKSKDDSDNDGDDECTKESTMDEKEIEDESKDSTKPGKSKTKKLKRTTVSKKSKKDYDSDEDEKSENEEEKVVANKSSSSWKKGKSKGEEESDDEPISKKTKKSESSDNESVTDGKNYEVEKILEVHFRKDGSKEFLIRWKGYKPSDDTWEPEAHLNCREMIEKFMEKVKKAKSIPARQLRESRTPTNKFVVQVKGGSRGSRLRNKSSRPCYQE